MFIFLILIVSLFCFGCQSQETKNSIAQIEKNIVEIKEMYAGQVQCTSQSGVSGFCDGRANFAMLEVTKCELVSSGWWASKLLFNELCIENDSSRAGAQLVAVFTTSKNGRFLNISTEGSAFSSGWKPEVFVRDPSQNLYAGQWKRFSCYISRSYPQDSIDVDCDLEAKIEIKSNQMYMIESYTLEDKDFELKVEYAIHFE